MRRRRDSRRYHGSGIHRVARVAIIAACGAMAFSWMGPVDAWQQSGAGACRVSGRAVSGTTPLPGVSVLIRTGEVVKTATSTDPDGTYHVALPAGSYEVAADLTGFTPVARSITIMAAPCDQTIDFQLALAPRVPVGGDSRCSGCGGGPPRAVAARCRSRPPAHSASRR